MRALHPLIGCYLSFSASVRPLCRMSRQSKWHTYHSSDPLDLGEALWIAHWAPTEHWAQAVTQCSLAALEVLWQAGAFTLDAR